MKINKNVWTGRFRNEKEEDYFLILFTCGRRAANNKTISRSDSQIRNATDPITTSN